MVREFIKQRLRVALQSVVQHGGYGRNATASEAGCSGVMVAADASGETGKLATAGETIASGDVVASGGAGHSKETDASSEPGQTTVNVAHAAVPVASPALAPVFPPTNSPFRWAINRDRIDAIFGLRPFIRVEGFVGIAVDVPRQVHLYSAVFSVAPILVWFDSRTRYCDIAVADGLSVSHERLFAEIDLGIGQLEDGWRVMNRTLKTPPGGTMLQLGMVTAVCNAAAEKLGLEK